MSNKANAVRAILMDASECDRPESDHPSVNATHISQAAQDVLVERQRQIHEEGWTPEHDDKNYSDGELSDAAVAYAIQPYCCSKSIPPSPWPWTSDWWKPSTPRRDLVKAAALLIAEIDRLDRAAQKEQEQAA